MALRKIRLEDDPILRKKSRSIEKIDDRIKTLAQDMFDTMYDADGVGLAAPQIGILKRIIVIDIGENPIALINPVIIEAEGEQIDQEGCLSIPGASGDVKRPNRVKIEGFDLDGKEKTIESEGLLARAFCHEIDHLDGILFTDKVIQNTRRSE